jgi:hypothetical protein
MVMGILILGSTLCMTCKKKNQPPGAPSIPSGPVSGRKGDSLRFSTVAEDPDGDSVAVRFDWGDSTMSDWSALGPSGDSVTMTHAWQRLAAYSIRAQARDDRETASVWSGEHQLTIASFSVTLGGGDEDVGRSVQQTSDGGYVVIGSTRSYGAGAFDVYLIKTDASGNQDWAKTLGGSSDDYGYSGQQTSDGGYVVAGATYSFGAGNLDAYLVKTDASGNEEWSKTFGGFRADYGLSVQQTSDGGYIIAGQTESYGAGYNDVWLIKTDASGDRVWDRTFGGSYDDEGYSVRQTSDGGYIVVGYTDSCSGVGCGAWLIKIDASGNKVWDRGVGMRGGEGLSVRQTSDGGFIVAGTSGGSNECAWMAKTDSSGNEAWYRAYDAGGLARSVEQTSDGGYVFTGYIWQGLTANYDLRLTKTDASGSLVWERTFGGQDEDWGYSVRVTSDGGYVIAGYAESFGEGDADVYLIKTDADGN